MLIIYIIIKLLYNLQVNICKYFWNNIYIYLKYNLLGKY